MKEETYNFDCVVDRHDTCATKFEEMDAKFGRHDLLPFWIADMDFQACPCIIEALRNRLNHAVLGYTTPPGDFWESITSWLRRRHGWHVSHDEITFLPGLKKGLSLCINFFTKPGDAVVIQPPVYHSFRTVIEGNGRRVVNNPLVLDRSGKYVMDFDGLTEIIGRERPAMMFVCNPHNSQACGRNLQEAWNSAYFRRNIRRYDASRTPPYSYSHRFARGGRGDRDSWSAV